MSTPEQIKDRLESYTQNFMQSGGSKSVENGGGPPHGGDMEGRILKIEALLPHLATKDDIVSLRQVIVEGQGAIRADLEKGKNEVVTAIQAVKNEVDLNKQAMSSGFDSARSDIKTSIETAKSNNHAWLIGSVLVIIGALLTIGNFMSNGLRAQLDSLGAAAEVRGYRAGQESAETSKTNELAPKAPASSVAETEKKSGGK